MARVLARSTSFEFALILSSISPALPQCCLVLQNDHKFQETLTVKGGGGGRGGGRAETGSLVNNPLKINDKIWAYYVAWRVVEHLVQTTLLLIVDHYGKVDV